MKLPWGLPISLEDWENTPLSVQAVVIALWQENQALKQQMVELQNQVASLQAEVEKLRERVNKNSHNSSKPPSTDGPQFLPSGSRAGGREVANQGIPVKGVRSNPRDKSVG
jgi:hypothetical protein